MPSRCGFKIAGRRGLRCEALHTGGHLAVPGALTLEFLRPLVMAVAVAAAGWRATSLDSIRWPVAWPLVAQLVLALFTLVSAVHGVFQHTNLPIRCGPLNWFFSMAELHRWHHSRLLKEANTNYSQNLIVWDIVFCT